MKSILHIVIISFFVFFTVNFSYANIVTSPLREDITVNKGDSIKKTITIFNHGEKELELIVGKVNIESKGTGGIPNIVYGSTDLKNPKQQLADWIKINSSSITLTPGEYKIYEYEIVIPENASEGGHYGMVTFTTPINKNSLDFDVMYGSIILVNVEGDNVIREIEMKEVTINSTNHSPKFEILIENTGNTHIVPKGIITLYNEKGEVIKNIGKKLITNSYGALIGEEKVDFLPVNMFGGSTLPKSSRLYSTQLEGNIAYYNNKNITSILELSYLNENGEVINLSNKINFINTESLRIDLLTKNELIRNIDKTKQNLGKNIIKRIDGLVSGFSESKLIHTSEKLKKIPLKIKNYRKYRDVFTYLELIILLELNY